MNCAEGAVSFRSTTVPELCYAYAGQLFKQLALDAKERPCFAKSAANTDFCHMPVGDFVAAVKWPTESIIAA